MAHKVKGSFSYSGPERRRQASLRSAERLFLILLCVLWILVPALGPNIVEIIKQLLGVNP